VDIVRRARWIARPVIGASLVLCAGCSGGAVPGPGLPTFPNSGGASSTATSAVHDAGVLPDDCGRVLPPGELVAVFGMPLDSVVVRTTIGVPAPSVGRVERIDCTYSGTAVAGRDSGKPVLAVNAAAYTTSAAARAQWKLNAAAEDGAHRDLPVGTAAGVLVERPGESLLTVQYGSGTLTLRLPARPLPGGSTPALMLVDLARRVLPTMAGVAPPVTAPFTPSAGPGSGSTAPSAPARAAGAT
jgi:hypothetical protein